MTLRSRVILTLVALVIVALGATDAVTYTSLRNYLANRLDHTLTSISVVSTGPNGGGAVEQALQDPTDPRNGVLSLPFGTFGEIYTRHGVLAPPLTSPGWTGGVPRIPKKQIAAGLASARGHPFILTVPGSGANSFRLIAQQVTVVQTGQPAIFVVALPLGDIDATLHRLLELELLVSGAIIIALAGATWLIVRLGLRPLEKMADTAGEIAAGNLSQRVDETDDRSEVGRLGTALNVMLGRIETAFREREASEARLRRFVADASHELRTPLTSIRGYAELFQHGLADRPSDLDTAMRRIDSESTRMAGLVDDLLLLARLDQRRPLERELVDLSTLAADAAQDARVVDPSRTVRFEAPASCPIIGDEGRLRQLVGNLVSNALAYTPAGSPFEVIVTLLSPEGSAPSRARISVVDHGPGIPPETAAHVFERFWRSDPARVRAQGGAGLGLSIVSAIADAHGGRVSIAETPRGGASFSVELPTEPDAKSLPWGAEDLSTNEPTPNGAADPQGGPFARRTAAAEAAPLSGSPEANTKL